VSYRGGEGEFGQATRFSDLSRVRVFEGEFAKGKRSGQGRATLNNDDVLEGRFVNGRPDGLVRVTFGATGKVSFARYRLGTRAAWVKGPELERLLQRDEAAAKERLEKLEKEQRRDALMQRLDLFGRGKAAQRALIGEQLASQRKKPSS
jgi:hypothetical protein